MLAAVRPYNEETFTDDTMTVHQVPLFGQFKPFFFSFKSPFLSWEGFHSRMIDCSLQQSQEETEGSRAAAARVPRKERNFKIKAEDGIQVSLQTLQISLNKRKIKKIVGLCSNNEDCYKINIQDSLWSIITEKKIIYFLNWEWKFTVYMLTLL